MAQQSAPPELPKRLPLVIQPENRDETTAKDSKLVNGYAEKKEDTGEYMIYKRPGRALSRELGTGTGLGIFNWLGDIYSAVGTNLYKAGSNLGTIDGTSPYSFSPILGGTQRLFLHNNAKGYNYDGGAGLVAVADPDFPAALVPGIAYLDATAYVMDGNANIYGSGINDTTSWDPLNKIVAQIEPDGGIAIGKQLVYVVAWKQWSTEIFYDAANATGSPLGRVDGAKVNYGCASAYSIQDIDGTLIWAATNRSSSMQIIMMDQLKPTIISTKPIERLLDTVDTSACQSWALKHDGHRFYLLTFKNNNITLVYDLNERLWHQWTEHSGVAENYVKIQSATFGGALQHYLLHESNGNIYTVDSTDYTDDGTQITWDLYTSNYDAGMRSRSKTNSKLYVIGDQTPGCLIQIRHSDDDYQSWSNFSTVDMNQALPSLPNRGTFYKRAHHLRHTVAGYLRLQELQLQLELGTN